VSIIVRALLPTELRELARVHAVCFPDESWDASAIAQILAMPRTDAHVACIDADAICGLLIDQCLAEDAEILTLGVAPASRRQGVARALLDDLLRRARDRGAARLVLEVAADNAAGLALYHALGFVRDGKRPGYYHRAAGPNIDAWRLSLDIAGRKTS
jgi:ribosomal-protein-alanine N-acetyltransferase